MPDNIYKKCLAYLAVVIALSTLAFLTHRHVTKQPIVIQMSSWVQRAPDVVIIGVKKGGTRALLEILKLHPQIVSATGEVHFYDRFYHLGAKWYLSRMPPAGPNQLIVEKTPSYFVTPLAPQRMSSLNPATRVVLVVRDPVDRLVSDFTQLQLIGQKGGFDSFVLSPHGKVLKTRPVSIGLYARHLQSWTHVFPPNQIHVVDGDQLTRDPSAEIVPLQRFLGLDQRIGPEDFYFNTSKGFYCWHSAGGDRCLGEAKGRVHPQVSSDTLKRLRAFYKDANIAFFHALRALNKSADFNWNNREM